MNPSTKFLLKVLIIVAGIGAIGALLFSSGKLNNIIPTSSPLLSVDEIKATNAANEKQLQAELGTPEPTESPFRATSLPIETEAEIEHPRQNFAPVANAKKAMLFEAKSPSVEIHSSNDYFRKFEAYFDGRSNDHCYDIDGTTYCPGGAVMVPGLFTYSELSSQYDKNGDAIIYTYFIGLVTRDVKDTDLSYYAEGTGALIDYIFAGTDENIKADKIYLKEIANIFFSEYIPTHPVIPAAAAYKTPSYTVMFYMDEYNFNTYIYKDAANPPSISF